jgi:hypothetical protein
MRKCLITLGVTPANVFALVDNPGCFIGVHDIEGTIHNRQSVGQSTSELFNGFDVRSNDGICRSGPVLDVSVRQGYLVSQGSAFWA